MRSVWIARDNDGTAWVHFAEPKLEGDGRFRDGGKTMICRLAPEEVLFPEIQKGQCVRFRAVLNRQKKQEILEQFNIVDFCLENYYGLNAGGGVFLADPFKALHDKYGWKYAEIHDKFKREIDAREDVYIVRTSDIFVVGAERKQLPVYRNYWFSHMYKRK